MTVEHSKAQLENIVPDDDYLERIIDNTQAVRRESDRQRFKLQVTSFLTEISSGALVVSSDLIGSIEKRIAVIDEVLSKQISLIMHATEFQKVESAWTALYKLVQSSVTENTEIRVLNCSKNELLKDFKSASDFDQSMLFKSIYESEYGTFGGTPFSVFVGDFYFDNVPQDIELLEHISHVAAAAHAPFLSAAAPGMLSMNTFSDLPKPRDLSKLFDTTDYARWRSFRLTDDSRYIGLTMPKVLGRMPYGTKTIPAESFNFEEHINEFNDGKDYLWINSAYELAIRIVSSFEEYGWCAAIRGVEGGGLVESLPAYNYTSHRRACITVSYRNSNIRSS